jgi:hypothetical protein
MVSMIGTGGGGGTGGTGGGEIHFHIGQLNATKDDAVQFGSLVQRTALSRNLALSARTTR